MTTNVSATRFNEMLKASDIIKSLCQKVECKAIENLTIERYSGEDELVAILRKNCIRTDRTPKQVRVMVDRWFDKFAMPRYSVEVLVGGNWRENAFDDDFDVIMRCVALDKQNDLTEGIRVRNNYNKTLIEL